MIDIAIISIYFIVVLWIGLRFGPKVKDIKEFSIGSRNFSVTVLVATLSGTLIGGGATFGVAEKTFSVGLIFLVAYCGILIERALTATFIADKMEPFFGLITAGDIMEKVYGKNAKILTGIGTITTSIFILGAHITTMGFVLELFLGIPLTISLALSTISMLIYSGYGGITAVSFTDVVQFAFMLVSIPLVALISLMDIGGFEAIASSVPKSYIYINDVDSPSLWAHSIMFLSYSLPALYPIIIQRMLMAKSTRQIKLSLWFNAALSLFFFAMMALIGLVAFVKNPQMDAKQAFPSLILHSLPEGIRGLVIVGLLATIMSTVDSFLNLISVSFTNDVLQPLTNNRFTPKEELKIARLVTVIIGLAGLISALYFNGILENVFASMNLWLPFVFPGLFFGIMRNRGSQTSFFVGIALAAATIVVARALGLGDGFFPTILAATANSFALMTDITKNPKRNPISLKILIQKARKVIRNSYKDISSNLVKNLPICDILSVFTLSFTTLPIMASAGSGARVAPVSIILSFSISIAAVFFILKDLWIKYASIRSIAYFLPLFIAVSQVTQPLVNIKANGISSLSVVNLLIGITTLWVLHQGIVGILGGVLGSLIALVLIVAFEQAIHPYGAMPQALEATIRLLALTYFFLRFRKQDHYQLEKFNTLTGVLAHEVGHSILSMNLCAHRLSIALPALINSYRTGTDIKQTIEESDLSALEELSDRLKENASRTKNTVQIIQTKILTDAMGLKIANTSVKGIIEQALNSGIRESINPKTNIQVTGQDFFIFTEEGLLVNVFINLIKNSLEALHGIAHPSITISMQAEHGSISIKDNGPGITPGNISLIFDENFTTKGTGMGKGLHFCKMILNEIGASIDCSSSPGRTEFVIKFDKT